MSSYSTPTPSQTQNIQAPSRYYTPSASYNTPPPSTPPVLPPKPSIHGTPSSGTPQPGAPPVPPPPRTSSKIAASWEGHDRQAWEDTQHQGEWEEQTVERQYQGYDGQYEHQPQQQWQQEPPMPPENWVPDILLDKSKPDLHHILTAPSLLQSLLHHPSHTPPILTSSLQPLHAQLAANAQLASTLSTLESQLRTLRDTTSAHILSTRGLESNWRKKQAAMEDKLEAWGPRELYNRLGASIQEGEAAARAMEESWLEDAGDGGVMTERETSEWIRRVREGRRAVGLRRERRARWDEGRVGGWR